MIVSGSINSPANYRYRDILHFHARDKTALSEMVGEVSLCKGVMLDGVSSQMSLTFEPEQALVRIGKRLLDMSFDAPTFERTMVRDPQTGRFVYLQAGLTIPVLPTVFESLIWAITGQQLTVSFAVQCRGRLIALADVPHSQGLHCHREALTLAIWTCQGCDDTPRFRFGCRWRIGIRALAGSTYARFCVD